MSVERTSSLEALGAPARQRVCWLHIGMHKTGSTSIQENLVKFRRPEGWRYLTVVDGANMGQALFKMFGTNAQEFHWFVKQGKTASQLSARGAKLREKFERNLARAPERDVIISAEALSLLDKPGVVALRDFLAPHFSVIKVVAYVRPPLGFMNSAFQQQLKHGKTAFRFAAARPKYRRRFEKFEEIFGRGNVILRKFNPAAFPNGCIVADFCRMLGIQGPPPDQVRRVNESLCREACGILYAYRKYGPGFGVGRTVVRENNWIVAALAAMRGRKFLVARRRLRKAMDMDDVRWMEQRLGKPLKEPMKAGDQFVAKEAELLTISGASCAEFAARFQEIHRVRISSWRIPKGETVDPRRVAAMLDYCRSIARRRISAGESAGGGEGLKSSLKRFPPARMLINWLDGKLGNSTGGRGNSTMHRKFRKRRKSAAASAR